MKDIILATAPAFVTGCFALLAIVASGKKTRRELKEEVTARVGTPNGHGNVVHMLEGLTSSVGDLAKGQIQQDNRHARSEHLTNKVLTRVGRIEGKQDTDRKKIETIEASIKEIKGD